MNEVSIRELRNHGGEVIDRVERGERVTITRAGKPVAELRPLSAKGATARVLLRRWEKLPPVDAKALRTDMDASLDPTL